MNHFKQTKKYKYEVGDLVLNGRGIIVKIHDQADKDMDFVLVHIIKNDEKFWVPEEALQDLKQQSDYLHYLGVMQTNEV
jgi:hypothetical protein